MRTVLLISLALALVAAASDLGKLQDSFMSRYDETNKERDEGLKKLESSYVTALERHLDRVKASGKLELVIPVRDEIQAVQKDAGALPELPKSADRDLQSMRDKFVEAREKILESHAKSLIDLADKMDALLKKKEADLTRQGKIDDALAAKRMRETLAEDKGLKNARAGAGSSKPVLGSKEWIPITQAKIRVIESEYPYVGPLGGDGYDTVHPQVRKRFETLKADQLGFLVLQAPAEVELRFEREISLFEGKGFVGMAGGAARFSLLEGSEEVQSTKVDGRAGAQKLDCKFEPTKKIRIKVEVIEPGASWSAIMDGRFR